MDTIQQALNSVIRSVLIALYQPLWAALLLAGVAMFVFIYSKEHSWTINNFFSQMVRVWYNEFRSSSTFRKTFLLVFYTTMILFRTVLNRQIWFDPLGKIMGGWGLYDTDGVLTTESIENFILFVPFTMLLFWVFKEQISEKKVGLKTLIWKSEIRLRLPTAHLPILSEKSKKSMIRKRVRNIKAVKTCS